MKRRTFLLLSTLAALPPSVKGLTSRSQQRVSDRATPWSDLKLWYRQPAKDWNEALTNRQRSTRPRWCLAGSQKERIQLNEETIWAGEKRDRNNPEGLKNLAEIRRLLIARKAERSGSSC